MNNTNSSNSLKKIKINLDYLGKTIGIELEPYKTINQVKEKTRKLFFIINLEFKLIHSNKDLTPFDSITIGEYFKNKSKIYLKVVQLTNVNYSKEFNKDNRNEKSPNNNDIRSSYVSNLNNSIEKTKINDMDNAFNINDEDKNNTNLITMNNSSNNIDNIENTNKISNDNLNLSTKLKSKNLHNNKDSSKLNNNRLDSIDNYTNYNNNSSKNLCDCKYNIVKSYYCREDNKFICKNCRVEVILEIFIYLMKY